MVLHLRTNAKVNLLLAVREKMADGFHSIETVFQSVSLADRLRVGAEGQPFQLEMTSSSGSMELPDAENNIVTKAARTLAQAVGREPAGSIEIDKHIPIAAGLAGGSANAAGALIALQNLWGTEADLHSLALRLGADVPFCLEGGTALASGRGEKLTSLEAPVLWLVLGIDDRPLSTRSVYEEWGPDDQGEVPPGQMLAALRSGDVDAVAASLRNDLEFPALRLRPDLLQKKSAMLAAGALGAGLSGSGPTFFGLARDPAHARRVADGCRGNFARVEVVSSRPACVEEEGSDS